MFNAPTLAPPSPQEVERLYIYSNVYKHLFRLSFMNKYEEAVYCACGLRILTFGKKWVHAPGTGPTCNNPRPRTRIGEVIKRKQLII